MDKNKFKEEAKQSIDLLFAKIDELESKKDKAEASVKADIENKISELKKKKDDLQARYRSLKDTSDEKWEQAKNAFDSSMDSFKEGISKLTGIFK
jgi:phage shock protein A